MEHSKNCSTKPTGCRQMPFFLYSSIVVVSFGPHQIQIFLAFRLGLPLSYSMAGPHCQVSPSLGFSEAPAASHWPPMIAFLSFCLTKNDFDLWPHLPVI